MNGMSKMTREEVIKILQELTYKHANLTYIKALDTAIEMLSAEVVSREVYEKRIQADEQIIDSYKREFSEAASVNRPHGKWIEKNSHTYICNHCGFEQAIYGNLHEYNFCPNCGAKMKAR